MSSTIHPAVAPVIDALFALADYRPASAIDLADVLKSVHDNAEVNLIDALAHALRTLAGDADPERVGEFLNAAADRLSSVGSEDIDYARQATGHWLGSDGTDSYL